MIQWNEYTDEFGNRQIVKIDINGTFWLVPIDESNSDYQAYLKYISEQTE